MEYTRRDFGKLSLATLPAAALLERSLANSVLFAAERPNSVINGVQVGAITYSYRSMPDQSAQALLGYIVADGINAVELMGQPAEQFAGAPSGGRGGGGRGRGQQLTPEPQAQQQAAQREAREALRKWRTSASIDKYKELRKLYNDAGVTIYGLKISPTPD